MNARRFSMSRPTLALAGGAVAAVCVLGAMGALASCSDPTASTSTFSQQVQPVGSSSNGSSVEPPANVNCPPGTAPVPGPKPGVTYCESPNQVAFNEDCMPGDWIPGPMQPPPPVRMFTPPPHPDTECPFYRGAYQNFMIATTPIDSAGDPALLNYPTIDDAFDFTLPHATRNTGTPYADSAYPGLDAGATGRAWLGAVRQAGQRNILVDQNDHTLYYGLHMNQAFYDFIRDNNLRSVNGILTVDPKLSFPPGLVEFKTAWEDIDPQDFPNGVVPPPPEGDFACSGGNSTYMIPSGMGVIPPTPSADGGASSGCVPPSWEANYITTMAWVPHLYKDPSTGIITEDPDHPRLRKVALVAIHSVYTLPGHAEFIWGSVQHVNLNAYDPGPITFAGINIQGAPDSQPYGTSPDGGPPTFPTMATGLQNQNVGVAPSMNNYLFYKGGTPENQSLALIASNVLPFDEGSQSFPDGGAMETVYRMFPGSKSTHLAPDGAVFSLNSNLNYLYANAIKAGNVNPLVDKRVNYRLVAAVWLDKPYFFGTNYPGITNQSTFAQGPGESLQNDDGTNPLVVAACGTGTVCTPPPGGANYYLNVSQGDFCGTPLDSTNTSGDSPNANGANNTVPGCSTRLDDVAWGDDPLQLYNSNFTAGSGPFDQTGGDPFIPGGVPPIFATGTDYEFSLLGGEDRLSSTAMETFTQNNTFHNCFACHNTQPIDTNGVFYNPNSPGGAIPLLPRPANINVSHLFSEFILRDAEEVCGASTIPCPGQLPPGASTTTTTAGH